MHVQKFGTFLSNMVMPNIGAFIAWGLISIAYYGVFVYLPVKLGAQGFGFMRGQEFLILLANTSREAAAMVGERLRYAAQAQDYFADGTRIELTVSLGCATLLPGESAESLLRRADNALYVAKREGRNRVVEMTPAGPVWDRARRA